MKIKQTYLYTAALAAVFTVFCFGQSPDEGVSETDGLIFPKGDEKKGRIAFEVKNCHRCHTIEEEKFPEIDLPAIDHISLAGVNNAKWTRDEYAHHIMDPEHLISPDHQKAMITVGDKLGAENSPMPQFVDALTVRDLINIATYLEAVGKL